MNTTDQRWRIAENVFSSVLLVLQVLLLLLWPFHEKLLLPDWALSGGRLHPILLHFPIVLLSMLAIAWFIRKGLGDALFSDLAFRSVLLLASFLATVTCLSGYVLSHKGDYDPELLGRHRNLGTFTALLSYLLWVFYPGRGTARDTRPFTVLFGISLSAIVLGSHFGGSLTHGEDYLFPDAEETTERKRPPLTANSTVYEALVQSVLDSRCTGCHNPKKAKGQLDLSSLEGLLKGGKSGAPWIPGDPLQSLMVQRILLDPADKKHMPPRGKPQLTAVEINQIEYWVHRGADLNQKISALLETDSLRILAMAMAGASPSSIKVARSYGFPEAGTAAIEKLQSPYRTLRPLYQQGPALQLSFFLKGAFQLNMIRECKPVAAQVVSLTLAKMPLQDPDVKELAMFTNLERMDLSGTEIQGKTLGELKPLSMLEYLSLTQTRVGLEELRSLKGIPSLKKVWIWNTAVDSADWILLKKEMPHIEWDFGTRMDEMERLKLTMPQPSDPDKMIFNSGEMLQLKHPLRGARILFTTDGSDPDTLQGNEYKQGIAVDRPMNILARAVLDGWMASDPKIFSVYARGIMPDSVVLLTRPNPKYLLNGGPSLVDNQKGDAGNLLVNWLGFRENYCQAMVITDGKKTIRQLILSTAINHYAYVFPPQRITVRYGLEKGKWLHTEQLRPAQPANYGPVANQPYIINLKSGAWKYLELSIEPVQKLPSWHSGKNEKAWVFLDEIFLQ
jgi:uncharacterized membrane protein